MCVCVIKKITFVAPCAEDYIDEEEVVGVDGNGDDEDEGADEENMDEEDVEHVQDEVLVLDAARFYLVEFRFFALDHVGAVVEGEDVEVVVHVHKAVEGGTHSTQAEEEDKADTDYEDRVEEDTIVDHDELVDEPQEHGPFVVASSVYEHLDLLPQQELHDYIAHS